MNWLNTQSIGSKGPQTELLQLALKRTGAALSIDGIFGPDTRGALTRFQRQNRLKADGCAGPQTWKALMPYITGYVKYAIKPGDKLYRLAQKYNTTLKAIETANPGIDPLSLQAAQIIVIPLGFPVVPTDISFCSDALNFCLHGLAARYPFLRLNSIGSSVMGRPIHCLTIGNGANRVLYNASHHANEWITTPLIMKFIEEYAHAYAIDEKICGIRARELYTLTTLYAVPMVNPDGVDLVTGTLESGKYYDNAVRLAQNYPDIPFPSGWKANIEGVDLNLQYPAGWENAKKIKAELGVASPGPRDYPGLAALNAPESRAMFELTKSHEFALTLSYHTQGEVIYWKYLGYEPENSRQIAQKFGEISGYAVEETPYVSGYAGYKDWFIETFDKPGCTIEAGLGESPLPVAQFSDIYSKNVEILTRGLYATL